MAMFTVPRRVCIIVWCAYDRDSAITGLTGEYGSR